MLVHCCFTHRKIPPPYTNDPEHCVNKFRDALKGDPINMHAWIPVVGRGKRRLQQSNAAEAFEWFGEMAAELLQKEKITGSPIFVPFPDSKCTVKAGRASKTKRLADAVAKHYGGDVADILRFAKEMRSSHSEGGTRDAEEIYNELQTIGAVDKKRPYIIIDDVLTTGGHMQAGVAELRNQGAKVVLAVCALKAEQAAVADPFARVVIDLPDVTF